jgi:hypothetical protein
MTRIDYMMIVEGDLAGYFGCPKAYAEMYGLTVD